MAVRDSSSYRISATPMIILAQLLGVASLTLMLAWLLHFRDGFSLNTSNAQRDFNVHPFCMLLGFIYLGGQAMMAYKIVPGNKKVRKFVHLLLNLIALGLSGLGLYAGFKFHNDMGLVDLFSLHSWLGLGTVGLYTFQWLIGFYVFWFPKAATRIRANLLPWHAFFGMVIFGMAILSAETGLVEKFAYSNLFTGSQAILVNFTGIAIFLFGVAAILTVILPKTY